MKIECPHCSRPLDAEEELQGMEVECPDCRGDFIVPFFTPRDKSVPAKKARNFRRKSRAKSTTSSRATSSRAKSAASMALTWPAIALYFGVFIMSLSAGGLFYPDSGEALPVSEEVPKVAMLFVWTASISLLLGSIALLIKAFQLILRLSSIAAIKAARKADELVDGDKDAVASFISFYQLTQNLRQGIFLRIPLFIIDLLMVPFPFFFHHRAIPNVKSHVWDQWVYLQFSAHTILGWQYVACVVSTYCAGVGGLISSGILGGLGAFIIAGMTSCFTLAIVKVFCEMLTIFMKIELNTRSE